MIYMDAWKHSSKPIDVPINKSRLAKVKTACSHEITFVVDSVSGDLVRGNILNTPPTHKPYLKGDSVLVHKDYIQECKSYSPEGMFKRVLK